jgi:hypothetical protein
MATIKLTDAQRIILAAAAARPSGLVLPIPKSLGNNRGTLGVLLKSLLADSWSPSDPSFPGEELWRDTPELGCTTLTVSDEGLKAIGTEPDINEDRAMPSGTSQTPVICDAVGQPTVQAGPKADSKPGVMISALRQVRYWQCPSPARVASLVNGWISGTVPHRLTRTDCRCLSECPLGARSSRPQDGWGAPMSHTTKSAAYWWWNEAPQCQVRNGPLETGATALRIQAPSSPSPVGFARLPGRTRLDLPEG